MPRTRSKALPTKVYKYGCSAPLENQELVKEQWRLANRYRNALLENSLQWRSACQAVVSAEDTELRDIDTCIDILNVNIDSLISEKKKRNSAARKRLKHPDLEAKITDCKTERKRLYARRKLVKDIAYRSPGNKQALDAVHQAFKAANREARKIASKSGLGWGTYLQIEDSAKNFAKGKPAKFKRFDRDAGGSIAIQIQTPQGAPHLTVDRLLEGKDNRLQLIPQPDGIHALVRLCVGGVDMSQRRSANNPPCYVTVRMNMHRPLPPDSHITWVKLIARRVGLKLKWDVHFTVARGSGFAPTIGSGVVGIDIGYRHLDDGSLRVAAWAGSDGRHGELILPATLVRALTRKQELQALRDEKFNVVRASLVEWCKHVSIPDWLKEAASTLALWRSQKRLHTLAQQWSQNRFTGDSSMYIVLDAWRKEDRHHLAWLANESEQGICRRKDIYGKFVAELRRHYGTVGLEDIDLREHAQADNLSKGVQNQRSIAAHSTLRSLLSTMQVIKVPAANTTRRCHYCGHINNVGTDVGYYCDDCGWTGDRDYNASQNILREATYSLRAGGRSHVAT